MKFVTQRSGRLIEFLAKELPHSSKSKVKKLIKEGVVYLDGEKVHQTSTTFLAEQTIEVIRGKKVAKKTATAHKNRTLPFKILLEDDAIIALEKPAGVTTISTSKDKNTVYHKLHYYLHEQPVTLINYIGRQISGILLFYKGKQVSNALQKAQISIRYCALIEGELKEKQGSISSYLKISETGKVYEADKATGNLAITKYRTLKTYAKHQLLEIEKPTHVRGQIRVHLSKLGGSIVGDKKYGATKNPFNRIALYLFSLNFVHPTSGESVKLTYPTPNEFILYGKGRG